VIDRQTGRSSVPNDILARSTPGKRPDLVVIDGGPPRQGNRLSRRFDAVVQDGVGYDAGAWLPLGTPGLVGLRPSSGGTSPSPRLRGALPARYHPPVLGARDIGRPHGWPFHPVPNPVHLLAPSNPPFFANRSTTIHAHRPNSRTCHPASAPAAGRVWEDLRGTCIVAHGKK